MLVHASKVQIHEIAHRIDAYWIASWDSKVCFSSFFTTEHTSYCFIYSGCLLQTLVILTLQGGLRPTVNYFCETDMESMDN